MARPKKKGLDYFTNDVNMYQDIKIRKMIRHKGIQSVSVYHVLLCQIYASGYYLQWDDDSAFIIAEVTGLEEDTINEYISYAIKVGLFDETLFNEKNVLTSHAIQERYLDISVVAKRKLDNNLPYLLVDVPDKAANSVKTDNITEQTLVFSEETAVYSEETPINSEKSTQRKEKKSKENTLLTSSADTRPREGCSGGWSVEDQKVYDDIDGEVAELRNSPIWREQVMMRFKFLGADVSRFDEYLSRWGQEVKISGKRHICLGDAKQHFSSWMVIQEEKLNRKGKGNGTDSNNGYRTKEDIINGAVGIIQRMSAESPKNLSDIPVV